jgi:alkaline phosphatase D
MTTSHVGGTRSPFGRMPRQRLLRTVAGLGALLATGRFPGRIAGAQSVPKQPFTLGVASGDPLPDGVVLWTRLAPDPLNGGGMGPDAVPVEWQIAADDRMQRVVQRGTELARAELGHSVHAEVGGLEPGREYWYQFRVGDELSPIGRTKTAPAAGAAVDRLRFAFASCQNYEQGYFTAFRHLAQEELDLVVHLGDYIYEGAGQPISPTRPRQHNGREPITVTDYRDRYALYKSDPALQAAHAAFPWIVTWDDHEVDNNYAGSIDQDGSRPDPFLARRANAYQVYYEHMPLRRTSMARGEFLQLFRRLTFGALAEFNVLDTRQYRTDQPCEDGTKPRCEATLSPEGTLLGAEQERWLLDGLSASGARWNVLAQQVMMAQVDRRAGPEQAFSMDKWDGYVVQRNRLLAFLRDRRPANPVILTGDIHSNWVADLVADPDDPDSPVVGTEFVGTSISSGGDGADRSAAVDAYLPENPQIKFYNGQRGYVRCTITPERWQSDFQVVPVVISPGSEITTRASFVVENGQPGAHPA